MTNTSSFIQDCRDTALYHSLLNCFYSDYVRAEGLADDQSVVSFGDAFELLCIALDSTETAEVSPIKTEGK